MIEELDISKKRSIWMHYIATQIALKHDFVFKNIEPNEKFGRYKPYKSTETLHFFNLWIDTNIKTFEEFCVDLKDTRHSNYIYGWYWRFREIIDRND